MASKCFYHPRVEADKSCEGCRLSICDTCEQDGLCRECRNKRKAIADRRARLGGGEEADAGNASAPHAKAADADTSNANDPDRVAYRSTSKVYKAMKSRSGGGIVASVTDTRVALTLGLLLGLVVLVYFGSEFFPASEAGYEAPYDSDSTMEVVEQSEGVNPDGVKVDNVAQPQPKPEPTASPPPEDPVEQQMAAIWQSARQEAVQQTVSARAVAAQEQARLEKRQAQWAAVQSRQAAAAEALRRQQEAAAARAALQAAAAAQVAARPPQAAAGPGGGTSVPGAAPVLPPPTLQTPPVAARRFLSFASGPPPTFKSSVALAPRLRYSSARASSRMRRRAPARASEEYFEGRLKSPLVTQW
jgi:hypothetical protein